MRLPRLRRLVWNAAERRPRAPVRLLAAAVLVALALGATAVALPALVDRNSPTALRVAALFLVTAAPALAVLVAARYVDRRAFADLGLRGGTVWWAEFALGLALGAALMTGVFLVAVAVGWVAVRGYFATTGALPGGFAGAALVLVGFFLVVGLAEELVARGYVLTNVAEGASGYLSRGGTVAVAVVVSSLLFGVAHLRNPNATLVSALGISLAGVFLAAGYVVTGRLAAPVGVHVSWNLFQGGVYGFPVSGLALGTSVVDTVETGPDVATGGPFGPEAGLLGVGAVVVGTAVLVGYGAWRDGELLAPAVVEPDLRRPGEE